MPHDGDLEPLLSFVPPLLADNSRISLQVFFRTKYQLNRASASLFLWNIIKLKPCHVHYTCCRFISKNLCRRAQLGPFRLGYHHGIDFLDKLPYLGLFCRFIKDKNGSKFSQIEVVRLRGGDPPPPPKRSAWPLFHRFFFWTLPLVNERKFQKSNPYSPPISDSINLSSV